MSEFVKNLDIRTFRFSSERLNADDYKFVLCGKTYYTDAKFKTEKSFLTIVALDELQAAYKKIAALEKKVAKLTLQNFYLKLNRHGQ